MDKNNGQQLIDKLQESEARFDNLVRESNIAIIVLVGDDLIVQTVNSAYAKLIGRETAQLRDKPLFDIIPEAKDQYYPIIEGVRITGEAVQIKESHYRVETDNGPTEGYLDVVYQPYRGDKVEILGVMIIIQDVTEAVRARKALEASEARFRSLVENSPVATCLLVGENFLIEMINDTMLKYWKKDDSIIGHSITNVLPELANQSFFEILLNVYRSGIQHDVTDALAILNIGGGTFSSYFDYTFKPLFNELGEVYGVLNTAVDVTEKVLARLKLQESEQRYRHIVESNLIGILFWDIERGIIQTNNSFLEMIGYSPEDFGSGIHWNDITPEKWRKLDDDSIKELLVKGKNLPYEKQYIHKNGSLIDVIIANTAFEGTNNSIGVTYVLDISARKRAERAVRESEERFRTMASEAPAFIFMANENAEIEFVNDTWIRFVDLSPQDALGQGWAKVTHPDDLQKSFEIFNEAFNSQTPYQYEMRQMGIDQRYHWILWRGVPRFLPDGTFVGILGFGFDITERKDSEEAVKQNEDLFRSFSDNLQNLAWMADSEGWIYWYNKRWYEYTGTDLEQMQGWGWEKVHHPDHVDRVVSFVKVAWGRAETFEITFPLRSAQGEYRWFLTRAVPVLNQEGKVIRWIGTNTDIHEQKVLSETLEQLVKERTEELLQSNEDLQQFAHVASHDLKEPVRKINLFTDRLKSEFSDVLPDTTLQYIDRIKKAAERMYDMIDGVLLYSSIESIGIGKELIDLHEIVGSIMTDLEIVIESKNALIEIDGEGKFPGVPILINQLFYNLISNSLKFTRVGTQPKISIKTNPATLHEQPAIKIQVEDNGIGFNNIMSEKIFETFSRLNSKDMFEGTGLGLALCRKIVHRHRGTISASGNPGEGARFEIVLPL